MRAGAERLVSPRTAFWITDILSDDEAREFAFGRGGSLEFPFKVAAKTGTSQGYHDNWAIGYTRAVTVGVWVGNFDRRPLVGSSGVTGAGPIFHAVMLAAEQRAAGSLPREDESATVATPENTIRRRICATSGMAATPWCPTHVDEWTATDAPAHECTWHRVTPRGVVVDWPAEYQVWARSERLLDRVTLLTVAARSVLVPRCGNPRAFGQRCIAALGANADFRNEALAPAIRSDAPAARVPLRIVSPPDGAVYLIDPTLRRDFQTLPLRATGSGRGVIEWRVDDQVVRRGDPGSAVDWPLIPGRHVITARDVAGHLAQAAVIVK